jgi:tetratricopeptide (TPR) repeat protein
VKRQMGVTQADLGDVLRQVGDYGAARQAYEGSLAIDQELDDERGAAVSNGQLGTLAMVEGNLAEAETRYQSALTTFRSLDEPEQEAIAWHQLGRVYEEAKAWEQAEQAYRASAQLKEAQGNLAGAAMTWNQLAIVCEYSGKPKEAEAWYRKAIEGHKKVSDILPLSRALNNLADLLQTQGNLTAAQSLAEEAIAIAQTLDPAAAEIWKIYELLAQITSQQGAAAKAQAYRRQSRQSYAAFAGSRQMLKQAEGLIQGAVVAIDDADVRQQLEEALPQIPAPLATAMQRILAGARDEDELCDELDALQSLIIVEILRRL